ncbi:MAG: hypothetical protein O3C40_26380 [Planctomycetota bacterium]|nr:hypothetical protein [Planctomycetota bacterium]
MFKNQRSSFTASLAADAVSLLRAWWHQDRIRSSPREGKLLRLAPGAILCVHGRTIEVEQRDVFETDQGSILRFRCRDTDSHPELWIQVQPVPIIAWRCGDDEQYLSADDIEVWNEGKRSNSG